jgi:hypothetical protein
MTRGLLQQQPGLGYAAPRQAATPQHGQKAQTRPPPVREPRSQTSRPAQ